MTNLYFPISALFCIILIVILFYSKEKINTNETKIYGYMILSSLADICIGIIILLFGYSFNDNALMLLKFLNKLDFIHYILWPSLMFLYII